MISRASVRVRFTLLYGAALVVTVLMVSCGIYFFVQRALEGQIENHLRKDLGSITEFLETDLSGLQKIAEHGPIDLFTVQQSGATIVASDGWKELRLDSLSALISSAIPLSRIAPNGRSYLFQSSSILVQGKPYQITVAHHEDTLQQTLRTLAQIILLILPVAVVLSLSIGYFIAGRVLAPISAITRKAEEIGAENLSERLPVGEDQDEFNRLAVVFNQTFGRIEESFIRLKRFTADASHELRTPLAAIRSIGETALHTPEDTPGCREAVGSILEEADRLRQMVNSLLLLSRGDAGEVKLHRETSDLAVITGEVIELLKVLAEEKQQIMEFVSSGNVVATIDQTSVRQAITNLLDNAIKFSPAGSRIQIAVTDNQKGGVCISIQDSGEGIPEEHLPLVFDRFYRVDKGRSREHGGAGLGLAIAQWAVAINRGRIDVISQRGKGSCFKITLPTE